MRPRFAGVSPGEHWWYTQVMPTRLKRHQVTELPAVSSALDVARTVWPDEPSPTELLYRLVTAGAQHLQEDPDVARAARRAKAESLAGRYPTTLAPGYLDELRREWDR